MRVILKWLCLMLLLGGLSAAGAEEQERTPQEELERLMTYYRSPEPERIGAILRALDAVPIRDEADSGLKFLMSSL